MLNCGSFLCFCVLIICSFVIFQHESKWVGRHGVYRSKCCYQVYDLDRPTLTGLQLSQHGISMYVRQQFLWHQKKRFKVLKTLATVYYCNFYICRFLINENYAIDIMRQFHASSKIIIYIWLICVSLWLSASEFPMNQERAVQ